jgi:hypothetical protein
MRKQWPGPTQKQDVQNSNFPCAESEMAHTSPTISAGDAHCDLMSTCFSLALSSETVAVSAEQAPTQQHQNFRARRSMAT